MYDVMMHICYKCIGQITNHMYLVSVSNDVNALQFAVFNRCTAVLEIKILSTHPSIGLSVTRVLCDKTKEPTADMLIPHERHLCVCALVAAAPCSV